MDAILEGGCFCGAVRYRARSVFDTGYCHCRMCQRLHGAPALAWVTVLIDDFEITGGTTRVFASSDRGRRHFCGDCGTQLFYCDAEDAKYVSLSATTFDDPTAVAPRAHIWTSSRVTWFDTMDDLPRSEDGSLPHTAKR